MEKKNNIVSFDSIVVDDGTREVPILNKFGQEICKIYFRPADWSILDRYQDMVDGIDDVLAPLEKIGINPDGTAKVDDDWAKVKAAKAELEKRIDALLDTKCAAQIFATRSPFSIIGGRFFAEIVLEAIGKIIEKAFDDETKASAGRMNKYLSDDAKVK